MSTLPATPNPWQPLAFELLSGAPGTPLDPKGSKINRAVNIGPEIEVRPSGGAAAFRVAGAAGS